MNALLAEFGLLNIRRCVPLGNAGGFSGGAIWQIDTHAGESFALKQWPTLFQDTDRLRWIHRVLLFARANGVPEIVGPLKHQDGETFAIRENHYWEVTPWARGAADYVHAPEIAKQHSAIETLSRFHQATARFYFNFDPSNSIGETVRRLQSMRCSLNEIEGSIEWQQPFCSQPEWELLRNFGVNLADRIAASLQPTAKLALPVQPVIRDLRCEHLFFVDGRVSAMIDFGAMRIDSVACDLARLCGSMIGDDRHAIESLLDLYAQSRPLSVVERQTVFDLSQAGVLVGLLNWLRWIFVEQRSFESEDQVIARIGQHFARLERCRREQP